MMDLGVIRKGMAEKMMMLMEMTTHMCLISNQIHFGAVLITKFDVKNWGNTPLDAINNNLMLLEW